LITKRNIICFTDLVATLKQRVRLEFEAFPESLALNGAWNLTTREMFFTPTRSSRVLLKAKRVTPN
jgi:hypothetical protein